MPIPRLDFNIYASEQPHLQLGLRTFLKRERCAMARRDYQANAPLFLERERQSDLRRSLREIGLRLDLPSLKTATGANSPRANDFSPLKRRNKLKGLFGWKPRKSKFARSDG
jgi:hypothetical protein